MSRARKAETRTRTISKKADSHFGSLIVDADNFVWAHETAPRMNGEQATASDEMLAAVKRFSEEAKAYNRRRADEEGR